MIYALMSSNVLPLMVDEPKGPLGPFVGTLDFSEPQSWWLASLDYERIFGTLGGDFGESEFYPASMPTSGISSIGMC